ncbi:glycosyltransferase family 2 protein [Planctomycetota bacterium]
MKVSVVTISLNTGPTVERTIDAIIGQSHQPLEWIVVDGGSTDGTLERFQKVADRITVLISEPDEGLADALNKGLAAATGEAVMFINAGDGLADEDAIARIVRHWDRSRYPWAVGGCVVRDDDGSHLYVRHVRGHDMRRLLRYTCGVFHTANILKRSLLEEAGGYARSFRIGIDYELWLRLLKLGYVPQLLPFEVGAFYMGGVSSNVVAAHREARKARELHGALNGQLCEASLLGLAYMKHWFRGLRSFKTAYRLKERLGI